ncbi:hypothetical protein GHT06_018368 [Daphnia sinensis]|uniref:Uncharacterized protein n=1 Tax=Daphnia sinensis TaxID=1820382 RepID=A0AAD5L4F0_9CRUS|nr:hypothetical protein GHT06_018368 [Daphnia sinensis]
MRKRYVVTRLEEIAFTACYREILSNLLLCTEHRPEDRRSMNSYSSLISLNHSLTSSNVRRFVRNRLNHHLVGIMNDEIRKRLVCEFNRNFYDTNDTDQKSDIWVFLDCVLDNSFVELDTHVVFPKTEPNEKFVQTICSHSPNIEKLKLNFEMVAKSTPIEKLNPIVISLNTLSKLTTLSLYYLNKHHRTLLNCIGMSCPRLRHLCITGFRFQKKDVLALMFGETICSFADNEAIFEEENYVNMKISPAYLTPFCSILQHLQLEDTEERKKFQKSREFSRLSPSSVALLLRNLPNLQRIDHFSSSVCSAVKLLYQIPTANEISANNHGQIMYDDSDGTTRARVPWEINVPFSGPIALTSIDFVNICDEMMMKAIGRMCPNLMEVTFSQMFHTDPVTPDQLRSILVTEWPKVQVVTFIKVSPDYRKAILTAIAAQLTQLTFVSCDRIDIAGLIACKELEVLRIFLASSLVLQTEDPEERYSPPEAFLPKLSRLESDICLHAQYSHLFEEKSSLLHLDLDCCHIGTKASSIANWCDMAKYWQRIHTLRIRQCTGLTMAGTKMLSIQLPKLKELGLPSGMLNSKEERENSYDLMDYFNKGSLKIRLKFERSQSSIPCPYQTQNFAYETSDEELSSGDSEESSHDNGASNGFGFGDEREAYGGWMEDIDVFHEDIDDFFDEYDDEDVDDGSFDDADVW